MAATTQQFLDHPVREEQHLRMTYDEFVAFAKGRHAEWVDGEVTVFVPNSRYHQATVVFLATLLTWFARKRDLGTVLIAPFAVRVPERGWSREPDLLFVARRNLERLEEMKLRGPADLVVELISDESVERDTQAKRLAYQEAGIPEYWLLDPRPSHHRAIFYQLDGAGVYQVQPLDDQGRYHSRALPGFWLDPSWLWQDPPPEPDDVKPLILATLADTAG